MDIKKKIKIGTRESSLAIKQAELIQSRIEGYAKSNRKKIECVFIPIKTTGDLIKNCSLKDIGGKSLFTKEIDKALLDKKIDIAAHSMKDCETDIHPHLAIETIIPRTDAQDIFISAKYNKLLDLPQNATLGTCSPRRIAQALALRPDLQINLMRGNVTTRISKILANQVDGSLLALSGLKRLNIDYRQMEILNEDMMTPAVGQGTIGTVYLKSNKSIHEILTSLSDSVTKFCLELERVFLKQVEGNCYTPVGGFAMVVKDNSKEISLKAQTKNTDSVANEAKIKFTGCVATEDGAKIWRETIFVSKQNAVTEVYKLGKEMRNWLIKHSCLQEH